MKLSRRHHYLPQMYLRGFADENEQVWVFDRQEVKYLHQGILNTAVKKDFYTTTGPDGQRSDEIEKLMANLIEGPTKRIIDRLNRRVLKWEGEDKAILVLFVALLRTRNLAFDKDHSEFTEHFYRWWTKAANSSVEAVEESFRKYGQETGEDMKDVCPREVFEMIRDDQFEIRNPHQNNIKIMMTLSLEMAQALFRLKWDIFFAPQNCNFITCDNPFTVIPPSGFDGAAGGCGILTPGASTVVPLSSRTAVCFHGEGRRIRGVAARKDLVRSTNLVVAANTHRFLIARDEAHLISVVRKTRLEQWQRPPQFVMNAPNPYASEPPEREQPDMEDCSTE